MSSKVSENKNKNHLKKRKLKNKGINKAKSRKQKDADANSKDFTIIKDVLVKKKPRVDRVLPHWLSHPIFITKNLNAQELSPKECCPIIHSKLIEKLKASKTKHLFPVQQVIIPEILSGVNKMEARFLPRDICVATPTGSGKTLSYVIPIIQAIGFRMVPALRALVLLPVVELAKQVQKVFKLYAPALRLKVGLALGNENLAKEQSQIIERVYNQYQCKVDILVATPGGVIEHILHTPGLDFSQIRFLVLDEADKLFVGEGGDVIARIQHHIIESKGAIANRALPIPPFFNYTERENYYEEKFNKIPFSSFCNATDSDLTSTSNLVSTYFPSTFPPMQRLLFSATLSHDPQQLQNLSLYRPILFTTQPDSGDSFMNSDSTTAVARPAELTEEWIKIDSSLKPLMLHYLLHRERKKLKTNFKALVFTNSLELTTKICIILKELSKGKYVVDEFSSKFSKSRKRKLNEFHKGAINVLISSDITARGLHFQNVDCVVSYDIPSANTYIHRIGRTARAGQEGKAITLVTEEDFQAFKKIIGPAFSNLKARVIPVHKLERLEPRFKLALEVLATSMKKRRQTGIPMTLKRKKVTK